MKSMEEQFKIKKEELESQEIPQELEEKLYTALKSRGRRNNFFIRHKIAASILIAIFMFGIYNFDALAYYGRKIIGYDQVIYGSLKDLNELGKGQNIGKSYTFKDGREVILDGVFLDANKLIVMYRIKADSQSMTEDFSPAVIKGLFEELRSRSGSGAYNEENKEIAWISEFNTPNILDKNLVFSLTSSLSGETGKINFKIDRSKTVKGIVKSSINKTAEIDGIKYNFTSLSATPMTTIIEGNIEAGSETKFFTGGAGKITEKILHIELYQTYLKDGKQVKEKLQLEGWGIGSNNNNISFKYEFSGLKSDLKRLDLNILKIEDMKLIDKEIKINTNTKDLNVDLVKISNVKTENKVTSITFTSEKDITFAAGLMISGAEAKFISESSELIEDGSLIKRTIKYEGVGSAMSLAFKTISKEKLVNKEFILYKAAN